MPFGTTGGGDAKVVNVTVQTTATRVLVARRGPPFRSGFILQNQSTINIWWGGDNTVATSGLLQGILLTGNLTPPATFTDATIQGEIWAIAASGAPQLNIIEVFGPGGAPGVP